MQWFLELPDELAVECRVGDPAKIRAQETRQQTHDRRDAGLLLKLLSEDRFPEIWMPSSEQRDLRTLLRDRHQWVRMRTRVQHTLQAIALNYALRRALRACGLCRACASTSLSHLAVDSYRVAFRTVAAQRSEIVPHRSRFQHFGTRPIPDARATPTGRQAAWCRECGRSSSTMTSSCRFQRKCRRV